MLKAQLDLSVPCPHTQDFEPCMGPGCSDEGGYLSKKKKLIALGWPEKSRRLL